MSEVSDERRESEDVLLRGAAQIGAELGLCAGATHYQLTQGNIKCARRLGRLHVASRKALRREFGLEV